jgi:hypothetical protein
MNKAQECIGYLLMFAIADDFVKIMQLEAFVFPNGIDGLEAHWQAKPVRVCNRSTVLKMCDLLTPPPI